ncbi:MAG TPA: adventurous gliding motility lipoprotein CglD [Myxococcaceae bacterium]|jgi:hypothetical protein
MKMKRLLHAALLASLLATAAACGGGGDDPPPGGTPDAGPTPLPTDPGDPNNASKDTDCDGLSDKIEFDTDRGNGQKTHPGLADTDQDGLQDGLELGITTPVAGTSCTLPPDASAVLKTNPVNPDSDDDGLRDGTEDANKNGKADDNETHPLLKDSDCDGLRDGPTAGGVKGEDQNADGTKQASETDPRAKDSDGDGISDGVELGVTTNLDATNCPNFVADADPGTTTDPVKSDSDGDGVSDGAEDTNQNGKNDPGELNPQAGDVSGPAGQVCTANNLRPVSFQSEGDPDIKLALPPTFTEVVQIRRAGTEVGEVAGLVGYDSTTKTAFLVYRRAAPPNATDPLGDEEGIRPAIEGRGALRNRTAQLFKTWDGHNAVQAFYDQTGTGVDLKRRTDALVDALVPGSTGRLSAAAAGVTGDFRLQALFVHRSNQSVIVLIALTELAGVTGANRSSPAVFSAKDLSDGSALAQFGEPTAVQCERFAIPPAKVDFLFVVDDSGSMRSSQASLAAAADSAVEALNASSLDWRMAMVTSNYHFGSQDNANRRRHFTRNVNKLKAWLTTNSACSASNVCSGVTPTQEAPEPPACPGGLTEGANGGCWVGISGGGAEGVLGAARKAIDDITPGAAPGVDSATQARQDATLVVVLLGDADDQTSGYTATTGNCGGSDLDKAGTSCENVQTFVNFFGNVTANTAPTNKTGKLITVHGIVCPSGSACGCTETNPPTPCTLSTGSREFNPQPINGVPQQRHARVVSATGGVLGSIIDTNSIDASMKAIIADAIGNAGYRTLKPPIGASIKVAVSAVRNAAACNANNIPRSTINGFDFDGSARTLSLFGACRPLNESAQAAVSYQYWVDSVSDPDGGTPCEDDPNYTPTEPDYCAGPTLGCNAAGTQCVCKPNCGGTCGTGLQCDMATCSCEVIIG